MNLPTSVEERVNRDVKEAIVKAGFDWRPYVLRAYCDTNMIIAESKGVISHPYIQFIMEHRGDIEARYSKNKHRLPPDMIRDIREACKRCEDYLLTTPELGPYPGSIEQMIDKIIENRPAFMKFANALLEKMGLGFYKVEQKPFTFAELLTRRTGSLTQ
jgi:hypothetical protein